MSDNSDQRLGIWLSPILGALGASMTLGVYYAITNRDWGALAYAIMIGLALAVPNLISTAVFGALCLLAFQRWRLCAWWVYALAGVVCGVAAIMVWSIVINIDNFRWVWSEPQTALLFSCGGALVGIWTSLIYWMIVRPDRDALANPVSTAS